MISVPVGTDDICFAYDIPCGYEILFVFLAESEIYKKHEGTDIISYRREAAVYHAVLSTVYHIAVRQYIIWAISSVFEAAF